MFVAIIAFVFGKPYYIVKKSEGNVFTEFCGATWHGARGKCKSKEPKEHFLDYAADRFGLQRKKTYYFLVDNVKQSA
jgi:hypothetical protein